MDVSSRKRVLARPVPAEGEDGLFTQSWYPVCMSSELGAGQVRGMSFLDGRIVVFRGADGIAQAVSAYCPHLGADLAAGCVVENQLRCAFHHWQFNREGLCVKLGTGDPPPQNAALFKFPTVERYGLIWVFNGEVPLFALPDMAFPDSELVVKAWEYSEQFPVDPWAICANTPDLQHLSVVHGVSFDNADVEKSISWSDYGMDYHLSGGLPTGDRVEFDLKIAGTSLFFQTGTLNGRWYGYMAGMTMPQPGTSKIYLVAAVRRDDGTPESAQQMLEFLCQFETGLIDQDAPIFRGVHFKPGVLVRSDKALIRFFEYVRNFPRAHPAADFMR